MVRLATESWNVDVQHVLNTVNWASTVPCCEVLDRVLVLSSALSFLSGLSSLSFLER